MINLNKTEVGILTVAGIAAGYLAYRYYDSLSPADKKRIEDKVYDTANKYLFNRKESKNLYEENVHDIDHSIVDR